MFEENEQNEIEKDDLFSSDFDEIFDEYDDVFKALVDL